MVIIDIKDPYKKNELIVLAKQLNCTAFSTEEHELCIKCSSWKAKRKIKKKLKELRKS